MDLRNALLRDWALFVVSLVLLSTSLASAEIRWRGFFESDLRVFVDDTDVPFERLESTFGNRATASLGDHISGVADIELVFTERSNPQNFAGLTNRALLDPWRIESDALFVEFIDVGVDGLDLRLGRQQLIWGTADKFHPTANVNAFDFEDPLKFGEAIANEMFVVRYNPDWSLGDDDEPWFEELGFELVFVPFFKAAQLPESAGLAFTDPEVMADQVTSVQLKDCLDAQRELGDTYTYSYLPRILLPERNIKNSMYGARMSWNLATVDMSVSYFRGFDDLPRAEKVVSVMDNLHVANNIELTYPRIQVLGADMAASIDQLDGLGLWAEVGVFFHDNLYNVIQKPDDPAVAAVFGAPMVVDKEHKAGEFVKVTVGTDYSPLPWWYINIQYLHGFLDEFGADNLNDYIVAGMDFKLARDKVLLRTFGIVKLQDQSWVLFPQIVFMPWSGGEIQMGSFLFFGDEDSKFGSPVAGRSAAFVKARASF